VVRTHGNDRGQIDLVNFVEPLLVTSTGMRAASAQPSFTFTPSLTRLMKGRSLRPMFPGTSGLSKTTVDEFSP